MGRTTQTKAKPKPTTKKTTTRKKTTAPAKPQFKVVPNTDIKVPTNLPRPSKGRNLSDAAKIKIAKWVCEVYQTDKFTFDDTLAYFGIQSHTTFHKWRKEIDQINDLFQNATSIKEQTYFTSLKQRARNSLERIVEGYTVMTKEVKRTPIKNAKGKTVKGMSFIEEEKVKEVYVRPSPTAIMYVLNNQDGGNFARNPEPPRAAEKSSNEYDHWTDDQLEEEIKRLEKDGY